MHIPKQKIIAILSLLVVTGVIAGYTLRKSAATVNRVTNVNQSTNVAANIQPSINQPDASIVPEGWRGYKNETFSLNYPASMMVSTGQNLLTILNYNPADITSPETSRELFKTEIYWVSDSTTDLDQWVDYNLAQAMFKPMVTEKHSITVAGFPAIEQLQSISDLATKVTYIRAKDHIFVISMIENEIWLKTYQDIISSIKF